MNSQQKDPLQRQYLTEKELAALITEKGGGIQS